MDAKNSGIMRKNTHGCERHWNCDEFEIVLNGDFQGLGTPSVQPVHVMYIFGTFLYVFGTVVVWPWHSTSAVLVRDWYVLVRLWFTVVQSWYTIGTAPKIPV